MNCTACGFALDSSRKGFIVCHKCGTVNSPQATPYQEHHITHLPAHDAIVLHASPLSDNKKFKLLLLCIIISISIISAAAFGVSHRQVKPESKKSSQSTANTQ